MASITRLSTAARRRTLLGALGLSAAAVMLTGSVGVTSPRSEPVDGRPSDAHVLSLGAEWSPWSPKPGERGAIPMAFSYDHVLDGRTTKKILLSVTRNDDSAAAATLATKLVAEDNGDVFTPYGALSDGDGLVATTRLRDGSILTANFLPKPGPAVEALRSTDLGESWTRWTAPVTQDRWRLNWYRFHRTILELNDGTLLLGAYAGATVDGVTGSFAVILQSVDGGRTFTQRSLVNTDGDSGELALERTSDGRLIGITRANEGSGNAPRPMKVTFSDDDGLTWEPQRTYVPPAGLPDEGIMPDLVLQPNGQLLLTYGRPDNYVAVSRDGTGRTWDAGHLIYANYPRPTERGRWMGSSGNTDAVAVGSNYSYVFGDTCHNVWSCREHGQLNRVWLRRVDAVTPGTGKIDLATRVREGSVSLDGQIVAADPRFPEQRIEGAVDGSSEYRAAARLTSSRGLTIALDREYTLDRIGLMLSRGEPNSARVQVSTDGRTWSRPVVQTGVTTDYALRYHEFEPVQASYVRITRGSGSPLSAITELELYAADTLTFENDAVDSTPRGVVDARYAFTADTIMPGFHSERRMILVDMDVDDRATATFPADPAPAQHVAFGYSGEGYGTGAVWDVRGKDADGVDVTAWRLHLSADFAGGVMRVKAFDGHTWHDVGTSRGVPPNMQWLTVAIDTDQDTARVTVNGTELETSVRYQDSVSYTGLTASTGLADAHINMEHSYDEVRIAPIG